MSVRATPRQRMALTPRTDQIMYCDDCNVIRVCGRVPAAPWASPILTQAKVWNV